MKKAQVAQRISRKGSLLFAAGMMISAGSAHAQTSDALAGILLRDFNNFATGDTPGSPLLADTDGLLYGVLGLGGANRGGAIFRISPSGQYETLIYPSSDSIFYPSGSLVRGADGALYGTSSFGGSSVDAGTLFKLTPSGEFSTVHIYSRYGADGLQPSRLVLASDGNIYGNAVGGIRADGVSSSDNIFRLAPDGTYTSGVYNFIRTAVPGYAYPQSLEGAGVYGKLVQASDGNFYGTAYEGGSAPYLNAGTIFRLTPSGVLTVLHAFDVEHGQHPVSGLTLGRDGNFYGTAREGGANPSMYGGVIYRISIAGDFTVLHDFSGTNANRPSGNLVEGVDGAFYGTTQGGPGDTGGGTVFRITPQGGYRRLFRFATPLSGVPLDLVIGPDGGFYGTLAQGGTAHHGSLFRLIPKATFNVASEQTTQRSANINVDLTAASTASISVPYTVSSGTGVTVTPSTLIFQPGNTRQALRVTAPRGIRCNQQIILTLGAASNAAVGDVPSNTLTINPPLCIP